MGQTEPRFAAGGTSSTEAPGRPAPADVSRRASSTSFAPAINATRATGPEKPPPTHPERAALPRASSRIEPLSSQRYKVQFTASAELTRKLELARDLMRHSHPRGELGPIVERALDLLIESLMQRRFGERKKASPERPRDRANSQQRGDVMRDRFAMQRTTEPGPAEPNTAEPATPTTLDTADIEGDRRAERVRASATSYIPRFTRRTVVERDGLSCSWLDEQGACCGSRAWLDYDHCHPRAKGASSEPTIYGFSAVIITSSLPSKSMCKLRVAADPSRTGPSRGRCALDADAGQRMSGRSPVPRLSPTSSPTPCSFKHQKGVGSGR